MFHHLSTPYGILVQVLSEQANTDKTHGVKVNVKKKKQLIGPQIVYKIGMAFDSLSLQAYANNNQTQL